MANVKFVSTSLVQATTNEQPTDQRIELTPCDVKFLLLGTIQKGLLFLKPKPTDQDKTKSDQTLVQHLKNSFSCALDFFTPLAGRLAISEHEDSTISYSIDCSNAGAQFVHAVADGVTVTDILEPTYVPAIVNSFFPLNGIKNYEGVSKPLLGVQITELVDGIFIGCTMNHAVGDGTSFWNFFNSWSEISRGLGQISKPPVLNRWLSFNDGRNSTRQVRVPLSSMENFSANNFSTPPPIQERVFHFSKASIAGLKAKANAEAGTEISSLQSLLAHLWRSVTRNQVQLDPDQETNYVMVIGFRSRLQPPLPGQYFGNAIVIGPVILKARELLEQGIGYAALQMNKLVACHTEEKIKSILDSWIENPKPLTLGGLVNRGLTTSSSPRFNVYGNDFGWGRPVAVRSGPGNKADGKITLFPGVVEGSVDIEVCVSPETLQALGNDLEFMNAVTI